MEWSQQMRTPQIETDQQFGFHEFVPGGSTQPRAAEQFEGMCSTQPGSSGGSVSILRGLLDAHDAETTTDLNPLQHPDQSQGVDARVVSTAISYKPPPSGPLVVAGRDSVIVPATSAVRLSSSDQYVHSKTVPTERVTATEAEDIPQPASSNSNLLPGQEDEAKFSVIDGAVEGKVDDSQVLSVDTMVGLNNHSAGSFNECGICGPANAIWVPEKSETGEPLVEQISEHGQNIKIDPLDTFWIQCDCCERWFHGNCVGVEEYEDVLIDKFHCAPCAETNGPTIMKPILLRHRFAFDDATQTDLPPEVGTEVWIKNFIQSEANIPPP
ncbi:hypothetical protein GCK32_004842 [Trichostrongylus colubriformis]|uniref:Zinc finger PHD-type domain-containing protein n=1 Tax=Trichostrongylus colubriformis TaxID=6319 RepID=A0AAN8G866_TRICO